MRTVLKGGMMQVKLFYTVHVYHVMSKAMYTPMKSHCDKIPHHCVVIKGPASVSSDSE